MTDDPTANLLGALALGVADRLTRCTHHTAGHGGEAAGAIVTIGAEPGLSIGGLAGALSLSHPGTVRVIDRLAADGLVRRDPGADGRAVALRLTPAGERRRRDILAARAALLDGLLAMLEPAEREALRRIADRLLAGMTTTVDGAMALCRLCDEDSCLPHDCPVERECTRLEET